MNIRQVHYRSCYSLPLDIVRRFIIWRISELFPNILLHHTCIVMILCAAYIFLWSRSSAAWSSSSVRNKCPYNIRSAHPLLAPVRFFRFSSNQDTKVTLADILMLRSIVSTPISVSHSSGRPSVPSLLRTIVIVVVLTFLFAYQRVS